MREKIPDYEPCLPSACQKADRQAQAGKMVWWVAGVKRE
jgi:hypothetical protein